MSGHTTAILFGFSLLLGCSGKDEPNIPPQDEDGDGYTTQNDCDDGDAAVSPVASEVCNGIDDDCDGTVDQDAEDASTWYPDNDGDGYGSDRVPGREDCEDPSSDGTSYTTDNGDCDDGDPDVSPAASEDCHDGVDNDCDAVTDSCSDNTQVGLGEADAKVTGDAGEEVGSAVAGPGDVDGDGLGDLLIGAPLAEAGAVHKGAAWLFLGGASGALGADAAAVTVLGEVADDEVGAAVAGGDLDDDGYADLVVGAPGWDGTDDDMGATAVAYGPLSGAVNFSAADALLTGTIKSGGEGAALAVAGDVGDDAGADLLVGEPTYNGGIGRAYLVMGAPSGESEIRRSDGRLQGTASTDQLGSAVAGAGDIDGDGKVDLVVGAPGTAGSGTRAGAAYVQLDDLRSAITATDADLVLSGEAAGDQAGSAVAGAGDLDGDGLSEVLVGAYGQDGAGTDAGAVYVVSGTTRGVVSLADASAALTGPSAGSYAGFSVAGPGDVNGDGQPDVLVGVPYDATGGETAGAAYLIYGPVTGALDLTLADAVIVGEEATDQAGRAVSGGGDADGDGHVDVLVGSPNDRDGGVDAGAAWLVLGSRL